MSSITASIELMRLPTADELSRSSEWIRPLLRSVGDSAARTELGPAHRVRDLPSVVCVRSRTSDVFLPGVSAHGWSVSEAERQAIIDEVSTRRAAEEVRRQAEKEEREQKRQAIFDMAKATGERQILETKMERCSDPDEQCSLDYVVIHALPNGRTKTERTHTY